MSNPVTFKFDLGMRVRDIVSSFEGVVLSRAQWLTGCNQYVVTPTDLDKDGKRRDGEWFDENRLEATTGKDIKLDKAVAKIAEKVSREVGGPQDVPSRRIG